jgi:DHA1 family tetracycline resistance protein-like MFS transporter
MPQPEAAEGSSQHGPPKGALAIIFLIIFTDFLGFGIIIPLLPFFVPDFQEHSIASGLKVVLLFSIFSACQFVGAPILGAMSDRYGRRPVLAISQAGSAIGFVLLGVAVPFRDTNPVLCLTLVYLSRIIDGFTGGNVSTAQAYISDVTTEANRAKGMGLIGAAFGIGFSAGPAVGGLLAYYAGKAYPAYVAALLAGLAAVLTYLKLPESRQRKPVDVEAWLHPRTFLPVLRRAPLLHMMLISFASMAAFVMMEATIGMYLNKTFDWQERNVGWFFAWAGLWITIVQGGIVGRLVPKVGEWPLAILGPILVTAGMIGFTSTARMPVVWLLLTAGAVNAAGRSLQAPTISSLLSKYSERHEQGAVFGLYHGLTSLARVAGPIVAGVSYPLWKNTGPYVIAGVITLAVGVWTAWVRRRYPVPVSGEAKREPVAEAARAEVE